MEIDVTDIIENHELTDYSDSVHNSGLDNIGQITWSNAVRACEAMEAPPVRRSWDRPALPSHSARA